MADVEQLKGMIRSFRVAELQVLLGYANLSQTGRKADLLIKALSVIDNNPSPFIQDKIQHLYQWRYTQHSASRRNYFESQNRVSPPLERSTSLFSPMVTTHMEQFPSLPLVTTRMEQLPSLPMVTTYMEQLPSLPMATSCLEPPAADMLLFKPNIVFESLPFYNFISEILQPSCLRPKNDSGFQSVVISFSLANEQIQKISTFSPSSGRIPESCTTRIHLRFCAFDESRTEQTDCWPLSLQLKVNNSMVSLPVTAYGSKSEARKCTQPIDITPFCHLLIASVNTVVVSWMSLNGQRYYAAVHEVTKVDSSDLLPRLNNILQPEITKAQINEKLASGNDGEIAAVGLQISFRCPLGKRQMQIPCRAATCDHLQCFDGWSYILMNEKKPTWICPICDRPAKLKNLEVDGYFLDILSKEPRVEEVEFNANGQMVVRNMDADDCEMVIPSPPCVTSEPEDSSELTSSTFPVIDLTSRDDETCSDLSNISDAGLNASVSSHPIYSTPPLVDRCISPSYYLLTPVSNPPGSPQPQQQSVSAAYPQVFDPFQNCSTVPFQHSISCPPDVTSDPPCIKEPNDNGFSRMEAQNGFPGPFDVLDFTSDQTMPLLSDCCYLPLSPMWAANFDFDDAFSDLPTLL